MKVILRQDVESLGEAGDVKNVSDGYARNYLIPKGYAIIATPGELKVLAENQKVKDRKIAYQEQDLKELADRISTVTLEFEARAGDQGRLFGSVTAGDIADKLTTTIKHEIDRRKVHLDEPIRTSGSHKVTINLVGKLKPEITVVVNGLVDEEAAEAVETEEAAAEAVA
ncbi:MAG: 50S ribosomal protein L9 [Thermomicrobiales bacterium]|nr:50S ribosomal protein L9 [Thermomicrobiales bacterium]